MILKGRITATTRTGKRFQWKPGGVYTARLAYDTKTNFARLECTKRVETTLRQLTDEQIYRLGYLDRKDYYNDFHASTGQRYLDLGTKVTYYQFKLVEKLS
jgi:hypothetical protein